MTTDGRPVPPPPRIRYRIELLDGDALVKSISVRGYRPTALREAARICAQPTLFESWVLAVSAYQLRRLRDDKTLDRTEVQRPNPAAAKTHEKESRQ
jgi:hypothetical protein